MGLVDIVGDIKSRKNEKKAKEEAEKLKYYEERDIEAR